MPFSQKRRQRQPFRRQDREAWRDLARAAADGRDQLRRGDARTTPRARVPCSDTARVPSLDRPPLTTYRPAMLDRRSFVAGIASLIAAPLAAEAQQAIKIGFLLGSSLSSPSVVIEPFKQTLREKGWIEGQTLTLEY